MFLAICRTLKNFCGQIRNFCFIRTEHLRRAGRLDRDGVMGKDEMKKGDEVREGTSSEEIEERLDKAHG
ncbi:hypothetical protein [Pectobacterium sp. A5351]|uniref:hypothetical protein n=1 Tax=Pectobacterium sp. A5351 TaxID=2914983 RepID=UPI00232E4A93|nr:hypothetical protein [Pectobacterium sp. A5351]WCG82505.1 hypothetical protein O1Q74_16665 [Pectobacterium sp. A5351]